MMREGRSFSSHERNCVYLNTGSAKSGGGRFANISAVSGLDFPDDGRAVALVDWDHDGDLDMWISNRNAPRLRLMRNEQLCGNHFLMLRLEGDGKNTNRDAIGARVEVVPGGPGEHRPLIETLRAGEGFLAQSSKWIHFGLGEVDAIDRVTVRWPGGVLEEFSGVAADRRYQLVQGSGKAVKMETTMRATKLVSSPQEIKPPTQTARVPFVETFPMPRSPYMDFDGKQHLVATTEGKLMLVNLWGSWCPACQVELKEFSDRYQELQARGIDVLALSIEGLEEDGEKGAYTARQYSKGKFPFPVGLATPALVSDFQSEHNRHISLHKPLPLPSSFLIDRQGRLSVIYKGLVSVDQILADATHSEGNRETRIAGAAPLGGQTIKHPRVKKVAEDEAERLRFYAAAEYKNMGRLDEVARQYADVLRFRPDSFMALSNLGNTLSNMGRHTEAMTYLEKASRIKPDEAAPYFNLANTLQRQKKAAEAVRYYQKALEFDPDYASAHLNLAITLQELRKYREAGFHLGKALQITPDDPKIQLSLGELAKAVNKPDKAIEHYQQALKLDPAYAEAYEKLGQFFQKQKKLELAITHYRKALELKPEFMEARFNLASTLHSHGQLDEAIQYYLQVLSIMPKHPTVHSRVADAYRARGEAAKAAKHYEEALRIKGDFPLALSGLASLRATSLDPKWRDGALALSLAMRACEITQYRMPQALDALAAAYAEQGEFKDAATWQEKSIGLSPEDQKSGLKDRLKLYEEEKPYREEP